MRTTRAMVYAAFTEFCKVAGKVNHDKVSAPRRPLPGAWQIDYDPHPDHTGYIIKEILEDNGIYSYPLGNRRRPAGEMARTMNFARLAIKAIKIDEMVQKQKAQIQEAISVLQKNGR